MDAPQVKDMFGQEIRVGATLLVAKKDELRLAEVDGISMNYGRNSASPTLSLRLVGRRSDSRYISSPTNISNTSKYVVLPQAMVQVQAGSPDVVSSVATLKSPDSMLIGSSLR